MAANVIITQTDNTIVANTTTDSIDVTSTTTNVIVSSSTVSDVNLSNVTTPIQSNSNISTDANVTADYFIANTAFVGQLIGTIDLTGNIDTDYSVNSGNITVGNQVTLSAPANFHQFEGGTTYLNTDTIELNGKNTIVTSNLLIGQANIIGTAGGLEIVDRYNGGAEGTIGLYPYANGSITSAGANASLLLGSSGGQARGEVRLSTRDIYLGQNAFDQDSPIQFRNITGNATTGRATNIFFNNASETQDAFGNANVAYLHIKSGSGLGAQIIRTGFDIFELNGNTESTIYANSNVILRGDLEVTGALTGSFYNSGDFDNDFATKTTDDLTEGSTNLYFSGKTTDDLTQGSTNLYFTTALANTAIVDYLADNDVIMGANANVAGNLNVTGFINGNFNITNTTSTTFTVNAGATFLGNDGAFKVFRFGQPDALLEWDEAADRWKHGYGGSEQYIPLDTDDLPEGNINLYYTDARVEAYLSGNTATINADTIQANAFVGGTFSGEGSDLTDVRAETLEQTVKNVSGVAIDKGYPLHVTGATGGGTPEVILADAGNADTMPAHFIAGEDLAIDAEGRGILSGEIRGIDTETPDFQPGDVIYVAVGGGYANVAPTGEANLIQNLGIVTRRDASNGAGEVYGAGRSAATPNLDEGNIFLGSSSGTSIAVTPDSNFDTTGNAFSLSNSLTDVNKVTSESATAMTLHAQNGVELNQTIDSTESQIIDINTDGYSIATATPPATTTLGTNIPSLIVGLIMTANSNVAYAYDIYGGAIAGFGKQVPALRGPGFVASPLSSGDVIVAPHTGGYANVEYAMTTTGDNFGGSGANGLSNVSAGLYGQTGGWQVLDITTGSTTELFPENTYVTDVTSGTLTFSQPATTTVTKTVILIPGMASSSQSNVLLKYAGNVGVGNNSEVVGNELYGRLQTYEYPETLANVTFDKISYANTSTITMDSVTMKNISDFEGSDESATRFKRALLVGPTTTPDPASARSSVNNPTTLGVILENDGESFTGNDAPAARFLINSYSGNLDDLTVYPTWGTLGATGNLTADLAQVKAPALTLKAFRGAKSTNDTANYTLHAGDVVGKITFAPAQTDGTGYQGVDNYNPPAAITVDVGDADITTVANTYMHITTTPDPGTNLGYMRNNATTASGANQQTNFTTKGGNVTIAAKADGRISLAPTPDYGDSGNSTVWTRYPGTTHEYHRFLDASFDNTGSKSGTRVTIQPASGTTTGSGGLGYDSKGNATIRLQTHLSNSDARYHYDITHDESTENLIIQSGAGNTEHISISSSGRVSMKQVMQLEPLSNTDILALSGNQVGDMVYNSTDNLVAYYDGTNWRNIAQGTIIS